MAMTYTCMTCRKAIDPNDVKFGFDDMGAAALHHSIGDGLYCGPLMESRNTRPTWGELADWMETLDAALMAGDFKTVDQVLRDYREARHV